MNASFSKYGELIYTGVLVVSLRAWEWFFSFFTVRKQELLTNSLVKCSIFCYGSEENVDHVSVFGINSWHCFQFIFISEMVRDLFVIAVMTGKHKLRGTEQWHSLQEV